MRLPRITATVTCVGAAALVAAAIPAEARPPAPPTTTAYHAQVKWKSPVIKFNNAIPDTRYKIGQSTTPLPAGTYVYSGSVTIAWKDGFTPGPGDQAVINCSVGNSSATVSGGTLMNVYINEVVYSTSVPLSGTFISSGTRERLTIRCSTSDIMAAGDVTAQDGEVWAMRVNLKS